jgi:hypothetical protein
MLNVQVIYVGDNVCKLVALHIMFQCRQLFTDVAIYIFLCTTLKYCSMQMWTVASAGCYFYY